MEYLTQRITDDIISDLELEAYHLQKILIENKVTIRARYKDELYYKLWLSELNFKKILNPSSSELRLSDHKVL